MTKKILFIGDDLLDINNGIPTVDQSYLHWLELFESQVPFACCFLGRCGTTTTTVLSEIETAVDEQQPNLVVFSCGLNDIIEGVLPAVAAINVRQIFKKIHNKGKLGLMLLPPMEGNDRNIIEKNEQRYQEFSRACLALNFEQSYDCTVNLAGLHLGLTGSLDKTNYYDDLLLTAKGHNHVAEIVIRSVTRILKDTDNDTRSDIKISSKIYADRLNRRPVHINLGTVQEPVWKELWFNAESLSSITVKPEWRA